jgi:hypothetical protein
MEYNLFTFGTELFQNSTINISFHQWNSSNVNNHRSNDGDSETFQAVWIEQPFDIFITISPPTNYHGTAESLKVVWMKSLKSIKVDYKLMHNGISIPCYVKENKENAIYTPATNLQDTDKIMNHLQFHSFAPETLSLVFVYSTILSTDFQYFNEPLQFEFNFEIVFPQDLPFNKTLITDSQELKIRMLLDKNRHSSRQCPTHSVSCPIKLIQPIGFTLTCHELDELHSLLVVTVKNQSGAAIGVTNSPLPNNSVLPFRINEIFIHNQQTSIDLETILETFPTNNKHYYDTDAMSGVGGAGGGGGGGTGTERNLSNAGITVNNVNPNNNNNNLLNNNSATGSFTEVSLQDSTQQYYINNILASLSQMNHLCQMFLVEPLQYSSNCVIEASEEISFIYQVQINEEIMKKWNAKANYLPFGYFKTPISLYWTPFPPPSSAGLKTDLDKHKNNDCHTILLNIMIPWSIGTTSSSVLQNLSFASLNDASKSDASNNNNNLLVPQNNNNTNTNEENSSFFPLPSKASTFDKIIENGFISIPPFISAIRPNDVLSLLQMEIEGPNSVKIHENFQIRLFLSNNSFYHLTDVMISTSNSNINDGTSG